jgi:hypothetical protein
MGKKRTVERIGDADDGYFRRRQMCAWIDEYLAEHDHKPAEPKDIATWIISKDKYKRTQKQTLKDCMAEVSAAMSGATISDPEFGFIRKYGNITIREEGKTRNLWVDFESASYEFAAMHFAKCHGGVKNDVRAHYKLALWWDKHRRTRGQKSFAPLFKELIDVIGEDDEQSEAG